LTKSLRLTNDIAVKALKPDDGQQYAVEYKDPDHPGFYLRLSYGGAKQFFFRYKRNQKQYKIGLGRYGQVSCADAYADYLEKRKAVDRGEHPAAEINTPRSPGALTVARLFDEYYKPRYIEKKLRDQRTGELFDLYARDKIGKRPAAKLTPEEVTELLAPLEEAHYHTARKLLSLLRNMYKWATSSKVQKQFPDIPRNLKNCPNPTSTYQMDKPKHRPVDSFKRDEIKAIWHELKPTPVGRALKLQFLTGCRADEIAGMVELELDREAREWLLPADRNKGKRLHVVPLTDTMLELIGKPTDGAIFPARSNVPHITYSGMQQGLKRACKKAGIKLKPGQNTHAIRRTVATMLDEMKVPGVISDRILNHAPTTLREKRYSAHKFINEKREALEKLEKKLLKIVKKKKDASS
jgi:integrase